MKHHNQNIVDNGGARAGLLEAGIALFAEKGYASTTVREIVARAGVSKPVLYYYFKNKEGIFLAILDWAAEKQQDLLTEVLETPGSALDRLIYLFRLIYQGVMEKQDLFKMIHNLIFGPPQGVPQGDLEQYHHRMVSALKEIYVKGLASQEVKDTDSDDAAILILSIIDFCLHMDYLHPESRDPDRPERLLRLAVDGLGRREEH
ncbi:MAG: TetR/AcrR family transcriptional regulator [Deltaproteobacteria bacterium]|nr:TetR/AcrR family transcriptional regulator [Deltaproteobacteria bacterium]